VYCCPTCTAIVEPYYYAAFNCIDWSDIGKKIGERKIPLKPKTIDRIEFGRKKYHNNPFLVQIAYSGSSRGIVRSVLDPHYSQTTVSSQAIVQPFIVKLEHSQRDDNVKPVTDSLSTQTVRQSMMLINPPFIIKGEHAMVDPLVRHIGDPIQTQVTRQTMALVSPPFLTEMYGTGTARPITDPVNTITAGGGKTGIVTSDSWNSFMAQYYNGSHCVTHITDASGTFTTNDRSGLITYNQPALQDCHYRMLKPMEVKVGMAFDPTYKILGSGKDQVVI
jgi:DNA (cytosine-5)-methyltransferase 1